jgi:hypothetical protein
MKPIQTLVVCLFLVLVAGTADASKWNTPEGAGTAGPRFNMPDGSISQQDAIAIQDYYRALAASNRCPAGTIPAGAGCVPAVPPNRWVVGQPMSHEFWPEPLPRELSARLNPSSGFHYVRVGGDVLLVVNGSEIVGAGVAVPAVR